MSPFLNLPFFPTLPLSLWPSSGLHNLSGPYIFLPFLTLSHPALAPTPLPPHPPSPPYPQLPQSLEDHATAAPQGMPMGDGMAPDEPDVEGELVCLLAAGEAACPRHVIHVHAGSGARGRTRSHLPGP